jgi:uncharacterized protein YdhG (YjbR/CyaY superfamily)
MARSPKNPACQGAHAEFLAAIDDDSQRRVLERLRRAILAAAPGAEECISYGIAAFRHKGRMLVGFGATKKHCAVYLMSSTAVKEHAEQLCGYSTSAGTVRFFPEKPLPGSLVKKLVRARIAQNAALDAAKQQNRPRRKR